MKFMIFMVLIILWQIFCGWCKGMKELVNIKLLDLYFFCVLYDCVNWIICIFCLQVFDFYSPTVIQCSYPSINPYSLSSLLWIVDLTLMLPFPLSYPHSGQEETWEQQQRMQQMMRQFQLSTMCIHWKCSYDCSCPWVWHLADLDVWGGCSWEDSILYWQWHDASINSTKGNRECNIQERNNICWINWLRESLLVLLHQ